MTDVIVQFEVDDRPTTPDALADEALAEMLTYTGEQIEAQVQQTVGDLRCEEHGGAPRITVTATYDSAREQMELAYHVDTCCQMLLLRTVQALNH